MPCTRATDELAKAIPASSAPNIVLFSGLNIIAVSPCLSQVAGYEFYGGKTEKIGYRLGFHRHICLNRMGKRIQPHCSGDTSWAGAGSSGDRLIATCGITNGLLISILTLVLVLVTMVYGVTSLPVPAVVGTAIRGTPAFCILPAPI